MTKRQNMCVVDNGFAHIFSRFSRFSVVIPNFQKGKLLKNLNIFEIQTSTYDLPVLPTNE